VTAGPLAGKLVRPSEIGISHPVIVSSQPIAIERVQGLKLPGAGDAAPEAGAATAGPPGGPGSPRRPPLGPVALGMGPDAGAIPGMGQMMDEGTPLRRYDFVLQFGWQPTVPGAPKPAAEGEAAAN